MNLAVMLVSTLFAFSVCLVLFMLYMNSKRKNVPDMGLFLLLFFANLLYMFGYALELVSQSVALKLAFNHVQYFGVPFIAIIWLMICIRFCVQDFKWTMQRTAIIMIIPAITLILNLTHTLNGLLYSSYITAGWESLTVVIFMKGPWYYVETVWRVVVLTVAIGMYFRTFRLAKGIRKKQALILMLLNAFGILLTASSLLSKETSAIDFAVLLLSASAIIMFAVLFKYSLFDLVPLAYSQLFEGMDYPAIVLADSMVVVNANPAAVSLFSQLKNKRHYVPLDSLFESEPDIIRRLDSSEETIVEVSADSEKHFYSAKLTRLNFKENVIRKDYGYLLVLNDVTSHVTLARDLKIEASTDPLTGLLNRRSFFDEAQRLLERAAAAEDAISLIMIDIDHYKGVNDTYGHQIGDQVLKDAAHLISSQIRENDILARYGGEEFVILLPATTQEAAMSAAKRMCAAVRQHDFRADERIIHLTISVGIATTLKVVTAGLIDHLVYHADAALYEAKRKGRDRICCHNAEQ